MNEEERKHDLFIIENVQELTSANFHLSLFPDGDQPQKTLDERCLTILHDPNGYKGGLILSSARTSNSLGIIGFYCIHIKGSGV